MLKVNGTEITAKEFAYDGCHKIYLINSDKDREEAVEMQYPLYPIAELEQKYKTSCGLEFINNWDLSSVVPQFAENVLFEGFEAVETVEQEQG